MQLDMTLQRLSSKINSTWTRKDMLSPNPEQAIPVSKVCLLQEMYKIRDIVKLSLRPEVAVLLHVCSRYYRISHCIVECERLLAEEEDAHPKADIVKQPNGNAYTSNPML